MISFKYCMPVINIYFIYFLHGVLSSDTPSFSIFLNHGFSLLKMEGAMCIPETYWPEHISNPFCVSKMMINP